MTVMIPTSKIFVVVYHGGAANQIDWATAESNAEAAGGTLAAIESADQQNVVFNMLDAFDAFIGGEQTDLSAEPGGHWMWVGGEAFTYTNWAAGEPDNQGGNENQLVMSGYPGTWNDVSSSDTENAYVEEFHGSAVGTSDNDTITAIGPDNASIDGGDGNDLITGSSGNDTIQGGAGDDAIDGGAGNNSIDGGSGSNTLHGGDGNDTIVSQGTDSVQGGGGDDLIEVKNGATVDAGTGNDTIAGGGIAFTDLLAGNALVNNMGGPAGFGEDSIPSSDDGNYFVGDLSTIMGGPLNFFGRSINGVHISNNGYIYFDEGGYIAPYSNDIFTNYGPLSVTPGGNSTGADTVWYDFDATNHIFTVTWDDVGHYGNSSSTTPEFAFQVQLIGDGSGDGAFDIVYRYEAIGSNQNPFGEPYNVSYDNGSGTAWHLDAPGGTWQNLPSTIGNTGIAGEYVFQVGTVELGATDSNVSGGAGQDLFEGIAGGNNTLTGGADQDTFQLVGIGSATPDTVTDFTPGAGGDLIDFANVLPSLQGLSPGGNPFAAGYAQFVQSGSDVHLQIDADGSGTNSDWQTILVLQNTAVGDITHDNLVQNYSLSATGADETLADGGSSFVGGSFADTVVGGSGDDSISGLGGDDSLEGGPGNDTLLGGQGNDYVEGDSGAGADSLSGGTGDDTLVGGAGNDTLDGGAGFDSLDGGDDNDSLQGGDDNDTLSGGAGADSLDGGQGNDSASGDAGNDVFYNVSSETTGTIIGISVPNGASDNQSHTYNSGIYSVSAPAYPLSDTTGIGYLVNPSYNVNDYNDFILHDHHDVAQYTPDPNRAVITFHFASETVVNTIDVIEHLNGITKLHAFVGDDLNNLTDIGNIYGSLGNLQGSSAEYNGEHDYFNFNNNLAGTYLKVVIDGDSYPYNGYAFFRMFLDDPNGVAIGPAQNADALSGNTLTGGAGSDTYLLGWSSGRTADTITDFQTGAGGDVINIDSLLANALSGYIAGTNPFIEGYLRLHADGSGNTLLQVDPEDRARTGKPRSFWMASPRVPSPPTISPAVSRRTAMASTSH